MAGQQEINEALLNDVLAIYTNAEEQMLKAVAKRVAKGITTEGWNETKLKDTQSLKNEIEKVINSTSKVANAKVSKGILEAYKAGFQEVGGEKTVHETVLDQLDIPMNLRMQVLAANQLLNNATFQVLRKANDAYQQVMANATTGLLAGVDTRRQASQKMLNEFASKGITTFVDKAGRNWDLSSYAEMAVRTVGSHAALQGHIDRQVEVGEDLVKVSTIGTTCPICQRWQGVVLSISGKSPKYHSVETAREAGLFHPNCKHTLTMFVPNLDGEGKVEPADYDESTASSQKYFETQRQRANERQIRYWKKRKALAIIPEEEAYCNSKIKAWQYKNLIHCEKHGLRRNYAREGVMVGNATGPKGTFVGGSLKDYEEVFKSVVGDNPKQLFKMNLQFFASDKTYEQWLKDEIQSLDDLDVDKAMMKDANNKNVTPTSLYKKYIGDNPGQDYAEVSEYEKGTKEYKSGYAKWLKTQIDEIGVTYKIKPKYVTVHEDIPESDKSLSATEIYKKYHDGKKPTEAFQEAGGEAGTGMKYGKWVETQKKELLKNGITKTVPFSNATTEKTSKVIAQATESLNDAKLKSYKLELDTDVHGNYDGYLKVKEVIDEIMQLKQGSDEHKFAKEKLALAEEKHLEMVKKKAEKSYKAFVDYDSTSFDDELTKLKKMLKDEMNLFMEEHLENQIKVYEQVKKEQEAKNEAKSKLNQATTILNDVKSAPTSWTYTELFEMLKDNMDYPEALDKLSEAYKFKKKESYKEQIDLNLHDEKLFAKDDMETAEKAGKKAQALKYKLQLEALEELEKEQEEELKAAKEKLKATSGKVSLGRETSFKEGTLVERDRIYQQLSRDDLEALSEQVEGHTLFKESRRDILGRDASGRNHHMGHKVSLKGGLSAEKKELGEAFQLAYDEYFNTIKCGPINLAYLQGYENATPSMRKKIDLVNRAIQSVELNEPILLHRYVDRDIVEAIFKTSDVHSIAKGDLFDNNTFMSTSTGGHPTFGKRNYKLTLQVDKGTHALPTLNHEELEVLLGKGKLEFVRATTYTSKNPQRLQNYDGSYTEFVGEDITVRYIEDGKAHMYERITPETMNRMLKAEENVSTHTGNESKEWLGKITASEKASTVKYTGSYYSEINNVYRRGDRSNKTITKNAEDMTAAFRKASTTEPVVLRRGIYEGDLAHMLGFNGDYSKVEANWDKINEGGYAAEDKGFLSTSPYGSGGFTSKPVDLRIYCPAGTHAAYVASISHFKSERETILQSGSIYKVHRLEKEGGKIVAYVELLGTD